MIVFILRSFEDKSCGIRAGMSLGVGLVGLGPHILGAPTKSVLVRFYTRQIILFRDYRGPYVVRFGANYF